MNEDPPYEELAEFIARYVYERMYLAGGHEDGAWCLEMEQKNQGLVHFACRVLKPLKIVESVGSQVDDTLRYNFLRARKSSRSGSPETRRQLSLTMS